jgi:hypothetical protein
MSLSWNLTAGESSSANMAHHAAVLHGTCQLDLDPLRVSRYILVVPCQACSPVDAEWLKD